MSFFAELKRSYVYLCGGFLRGERVAAGAAYTRYFHCFTHANG